ncbi:Twitchin [Portunus trituberculatus]|uniref:Twitchin n=1 Tax=Portunus trituberculatus TaxID=210409 RepID=A0A5B7D2V2_PORTR|nr:Twitchin [Portunus trituberculatus]
MGHEIQGDVLEGTIPNLKEGNQYEFRIRAVNKAGPGEPSDPTKPIQAKHRFVKPYVINKEEFRNIVIKKTQLFKLDVRYAGEPEPTVIWKKDDKEIQPDEEERRLKRECNEGEKENDLWETNTRGDMTEVS